MSTFNNNQTQDGGSIPVRMVASTSGGLTLASNTAIGTGTQTAPVTGVGGGSYLWAVTGTFGGATLTLQTLGPDGATWIGLSPAATLTASGTVGVVLGANASVRIAATGGSATAVYSSLS